VTEIQQWANVGGTRGFIHVPDFVLPYYGSELTFELSRSVFNMNGCDFNMENHTQRVGVHEYSNSAVDSQETLMFGNFATLALSSSPDPSWGDLALKTQQVLDACLMSARSDGKIVELGP
jgi:hypothetical protein